jgi:NitT/TauT family transport system substrate-binding protein
MSEHGLAVARLGQWTGVPRALLAGALIMATVAACGGSTAGTKAASDSSPSAAGLSGKRLIVMAQGSSQANRVVEHHALELLKEQGVKAELRFNEGATNIAIAQLQSGNIDVYSEAVAGGVGGVAAGLPLVDFALAQPRQDYVFLAKKGINSLADLKGKKIGVQDTTGVNYAQALLVLQKAGLSVKDVSIIPTGGQSVRLPALVAGRVDATMLSHKAEITLKPKGFNTLFDYTKEASDLYDDNFFTTRKWLEANGDLAVAVNKALLDSFAWFSDQAKADEVVSEALTLDPEANKADLVSLFGALRAADAYPVGSILDKNALSTQQDLFVKAGAAPKAVPVEQWVDTSFGEKAKAQS